jgi:hypothetical protein
MTRLRVVHAEDNFTVRRAPCIARRKTKRTFNRLNPSGEGEVVGTRNVRLRLRAAADAPGAPTSSSA